MDTTLKNMDYPEMEWIPHGFFGERMNVLPGPLVAGAERHPLLRGLFPCDAGYFPEAHHHGISRKNGTRSALLIVCQAGCGWVELGGERLPVAAHEAVLIAPHQPHAYGASESNPWTIQWVHFMGSEVPDWWEWHNLPAAGGVLTLAGAPVEQLHLADIHETLAQGYDQRHLLRAAASLRLALAQLTPGGSTAPGRGSREAVEAVEAWMREHLAESVTLDQLARRASLSSAHFSSVFRLRFGFSPVDYFLRLKIRRACNLLDSTRWPVARVAEAVGIEDPFYFSRRFRKIMGMAPRDYRSEKFTEGLPSHYG